MSVALDALGIVADALGIFGFFNTGVPTTGATVRIHAAHQFSDDQNMGGNIMALDAYDSFNRLVSSINGGYVNEGGYADFQFDQSNPGLQVQDVSIRNDNDATCIVFATISQTDGTPGSAWIGDIGRQCGQYWYPSNVTVGQTDDDNHSPIIPGCTWLDSDGSNGIPSGAMKINFLAYGQGLTDTYNAGTACANTIFQYGNGQIDGAPGQKKKRSSRSQSIEKTRKEWMNDVLVVSKHKHHTAKELCESSMSYGPDFVGSDGYFCDMSKHELIPLCSTHKINGCASVEGSHVKINKKKSSLMAAESKLHHSYKHVHQW